MPPDSVLIARPNAIAYVLTAAALWFVLALHLLPALFTGLLVYSLVTALAPALQRHVPGVRAHWLAVALLAILVVGLFTIAIAAAVAFLNSENGNPTVFFERLTPLIERAHAQLPKFIVDRLPDDSAEMRTAVIDWLGENTAQLKVAGRQAVRVVLQLIIGIVLGVMLALHGAHERPPGGLTDCGAQGACRASRRCVPRRSLYAGEDFGTEYAAHRRVLAHRAAPVRSIFTAGQDAGRHYLRGWLTAGDWQPDLQHPHLRRCAVKLTACGDSCTRIPDCYTQA